MLDGPQGPWVGYSFAEAEWDENPVSLFRWNGSDSSGYPNSRGIAMWVVIPPPFADAIREALKEAPPSAPDPIEEEEDEE